MELQATMPMMALEHDMIGISMTNASPLVAPTFSQERLLGTNPIAVAIPAKDQPPFVADMATHYRCQWQTGDSPAQRNGLLHLDGYKIK